MMLSSPASTPPPDLRPWFIKQYQLFTAALETQNLQDWVICVGNEAGDLDTLASSIAFAYLSSYFAPARISKYYYIPVQLTRSTDFELRPENLEALRSADLLDETLSLPMAELICADRLDYSRLTQCGAKYALVDHNEIKASVFGSSAQVVSLIDHHEPAADNTLYPTAEPRLIVVPTGSCSSLVANYFATRWPQPALPSKLADLLLSAISIDTNNFKPLAAGGKATEADTRAKQWLLARSRFYLAPIPEHPADGLQPGSATSASAEADLNVQLGEFHKHLSNLKNDVSRLSSAQLLARDYKQYDLLGWELGLSTVPVELARWVGNKAGGSWTSLLDVLNEHARLKGLDIAGILTNSKLSKKEAFASGEVRHRRELVLLATNARVAQVLDHLEAQDKTLPPADSLQLSPLVIGEQQPAIKSWAAGKAVQLRIWRVGNLSSTRKQLAPILTRLIKALGTK